VGDAGVGVSETPEIHPLWPLGQRRNHGREVDF